MIQSTGVVLKSHETNKKKSGDFDYQKEYKKYSMFSKALQRFLK